MKGIRTLITFGIAAGALILLVFVMRFVLSKPADNAENAKKETYTENESETNEEINITESKDTAETETAGDDTESIQEADIMDAIHRDIIKKSSAYSSPVDAGEYKAVSFIELAREENDAELTVYGFARYMEADTDESGIYERLGFHMPLALTYDIGGGEYLLKDYWQPEDGSYYAPSIRDKFPKNIADLAIDTQSTVYWQTADCYAQVISLSGLDTEAVIQGLLDKICTPGVSSSVDDYIDNASLEFRELLYYGQYTVDFYNKHEAGQKTLYSEVLAAACEKINAIM